MSRQGIRFGGRLMQRLKRGSGRSEADLFRTAPKFETGAAKYRWLMNMCLSICGATRSRRARRASVL